MGTNNDSDGGDDANKNLGDKKYGGKKFMMGKLLKKMMIKKTLKILCLDFLVYWVVVVLVRKVSEAAFIMALVVVQKVLKVAFMVVFMCNGIFYNSGLKVVRTYVYYIHL